MKLNPECIRAILLFTEESVNLYEYAALSSDRIPESLSDYSFAEISYHVRQCELSGLFAEEVSWSIDGNCMVPYLSPEGHRFLSDIRSDTNWNKTKEIAQNVGSNSLNAIKEIATGVITALIQKQLGLQ